MNENINISKIDRIVEETGRDVAAVIPILQAVQKAFKYLPEAALRRVCETTEITPAQIEGVASFFSQFRRSPVGKHMISVCDGTACHVKGSSAVYGSVLHSLGIKEGDTDADGLFTVQKVACLGCCTLAPAVQIDETTYGHVRTDTVSNMITDFLENEANRVPKKFRSGWGWVRVAWREAAPRSAMRWRKNWLRSSARWISSQSVAWACATARRWWRW